MGCTVTSVIILSRRFSVKSNFVENHSRKTAKWKWTKKPRPRFQSPFQMSLSVKWTIFFDDWKVEGIMKQDSSLRNITFVKNEKNETEYKTMRNLGNIHQREFLKK